LPNKVIAQRLGLTENTVNVSAILQQLGARSRMQMMSQMRQLSVAPPASTDKINILMAHLIAP